MKILFPADGSPYTKKALAFLITHENFCGPEDELIVLGTHGRRGIGRVLLGSGAEQIIRSAQVPVLVIRADEDSQVEPSLAAQLATA